MPRAGDTGARRMHATSAKVDVVAIDGPVGSGKSTAAKRLAAELGFRYIDTGAMYRAVTLEAVRRGVDLEDADSLGDVANSVEIALETVAATDEGGGGAGRQRVLLGGEDVSEEIRTPELTARVRHIARAAPVREWMRGEQRRLGLAGPSVMEGRDIGTVVFPDARWKFYLDATVAERARRRRRELEAKGISLSDAELENEVRIRDRTDLEREIAPLKCADDAERVDTTGMAIDEVVGHLARQVRGE